MKTLQKFYFPAFIIEAVRPFAGKAYNATIEIVAKNGELFIGGTDRVNMLYTRISEFMKDSLYKNEINGDFRAKINIADLSQYADEFCKNFSARERRMIVLGIEIIEKDNGVNVARIFVPDYNRDAMESDIDYADFLDGSYFSHLNHIVSCNNPECDEASHIPLECMKMSKKALKLLTGKSIDPVFKENGWEKMAFLFNENFIIVIPGFRKSFVKGHYSTEPGQWANI